MEKQNCNEEHRLFDQGHAECCATYPLTISGVGSLTMYQQWNPNRKIALGSVNPYDLRSGLLFTDVGIDQKGFVMSDYNYRVISLKILSDQTYAVMAAKLRELRFDTRLLLTVHVPNQ